MEAAWIAGGREVFTFSLDGIIRIWDVSPAAGTLDELQREAELLSSHRLVPGLGVTPLTVEEIRERWRALRPDWK